MRSKLNVDRLKLRQQAGFCAVSPVGFNVLGTEYERVLPASSVANLFPFNYSGKTDRKGFYIGKDKYGSNIVVDFDQRDEDKTSANVLILGNSGQGKSYLMKLLLLNFLEAGKSLPHCQVMNSRKRQPQRKIFVAAVLIGGLKQKNPRLYQGNKNFSIA